MVKVFISYSRKDSETMQQIYDLLSHTFDVWVDTAPQAIVGGEEWWEKIQNEVIERRIFVYIASTSSAKSEWCQKEIELARQYNKYIVPILMEHDIDLNELSKLQVIDYTKYDLAETISRVFGAIVSQLTTFDDEKREADLRLLEKFRTTISSRLLENIDAGIDLRHVYKEVYNTFVLEFLYLHKLPENHFYNNELNKLFEQYANQLEQFRSSFAQLSVGGDEIYDISSRGFKNLKETYYPKLREIGKNFDEFSHIHEKLILFIRQNYPEFDFNDE